MRDLLVVLSEAPPEHPSEELLAEACALLDGGQIHDVDAADSRARTALHLAAARPGHLPVIDRLLRLGATVNAQNTHGSTPLHFAVQHGHVEAATALIKAGADLTLTNQQGRPALFAASDVLRVKLMGIASARTDGPPVTGLWRPKGEGPSSKAPPEADPVRAAMPTGPKVVRPTPLASANGRPRTAPAPGIHASELARLRAGYRKLIKQHLDTAKEGPATAVSDELPKRGAIRSAATHWPLVERWLEVARREQEGMASYSKLSVALATADDMVQVEKDLKRSHCMATEGLPVPRQRIAQLRRVLRAWCNLYPALGYTQGMSHLALFLLQLACSARLVSGGKAEAAEVPDKEQAEAGAELAEAEADQAEEDAFALFVLLNARLPPDFYVPQLRGCEREFESLMLILDETRPAPTWLDAGHDAAAVRFGLFFATIKWWLALWCDSLPLPLVVQVCDRMISASLSTAAAAAGLQTDNTEPSDANLRFTLVILALAEEHIATSLQHLGEEELNPGSVSQVMREAVLQATDTTSPEALARAVAELELPDGIGTSTWRERAAASVTTSEAGL